MAIRGKKNVPTKTRAIVGSAMRFEIGGEMAWRSMPEGDRGWQREVWHHYDSCPEFQSAITWKGNTSSRATLYAADIDPDTGRPMGPTEDPTIREIARNILGGPTQQSQHTKMMVTNLDAVGEVYTVILASESGDDEWLTLSVTELSFTGGIPSFVYPKTNEVRKLTDGDLYIRHWEQHPRLQLNANAPSRSLIPVLREIENTSKNIAARLDSRQASNGLLLVPIEADFADGDDDPEGPTGLAGQLAKTMAASMRDAGNAAAQVPIILQADRENLAAIEHITLDTELSKEVADLRKDSIDRLYTGLDLPREVQTGMGASSNHWGAWKVAEDTYTTHIMPKLELISDGLTRTYLIPVAEAMGIKDAGKRFMLVYDGSDIIGEPDPLEEAVALYDRGAINVAALRQLTSTPEDLAPTLDEQQRALAIDLVKSAPALFPQLAKFLGFGQGDIGVAPAGEPAAITSDGPPSMPAVTAAADFRAASLAVTYALERAGNRLLNTQRLKDEFSNIPRHELHARIKPDPDRHGDLLADAWRHAAPLAVAYDLDRYTRALLAVGVAHSDENLREWLARRA